MRGFRNFILRFSTLALVSLAAGVLVPACASTDTVLDADDYDQTCQTVDDCEAVLVGNMCGCGCDWGAISKSELERFEADDGAAREACGDTILSCVACEDAAPLACESGKCTFMQ